MADSKTQIANWALYTLGARRISDLTGDTNKKAVILNDLYDPVRKSLIAAYPWNFALKRDSIAADGGTPAWEFSKQYTLPTDFLSLVKIQDDPIYKIESGFILTDEGSPLKIQYIRNETTTSNFDPLFDKALAKALAYEAVEAITQSNTKKNLIGDEFFKVMKEAFANDAIQDPPQELKPDTWLTAREDSYYDDINYNI